MSLLKTDVSLIPRQNSLQRPIIDVLADRSADGGSSRRLKLAGVGCGSRTSTYLKLAAALPDRYDIVGGADPIDWKVNRIAGLSKNADFRSFDSAEALLAVDKFADVLVVGTQDSYHIAPCIAALEKGYDILLEKPIATNPADCLRLESIARRLGRRVLICHVLRYTPFYQKVKQIVDSGQLGQIITLKATEGVGTFHQAHSFVRGHWSVTETSSPMIIQKSCHDLDIIQWLIDRPFKSIASFGRVSHFCLPQKPKDAPLHCVDGCPVASTCQYNAERYLTDQRGWIPYVYNGSEKATDDELREWLKTSRWGRCVYQCDNTAVDHQVVNIDFDGGATAALTMSAFDSGRNIEVWGTKGVLRGGTYTKQIGDTDIIVRDHASGRISKVSVDRMSGGYDSHGGGDFGLVDALYDEMHVDDPSMMRSSLSVSVQSHLMGYAAEQARVENRVVDAASFISQHKPH